MFERQMVKQRWTCKAFVRSMVKMKQGVSEECARESDRGKGVERRKREGRMGVLCCITPLELLVSKRLLHVCYCLNLVFTRGVVSEGENKHGREVATPYL